MHSESVDPLSNTVPDTPESAINIGSDVIVDYPSKPLDVVPASTFDDRFMAASMQAALESTQQSVNMMKLMLSTGTDPADMVENFTAAAISTVPRWHFPMLNDLERNDAFAVALERVMIPGAHVLDIGSGTGLLAMMAARAGAASVTTCEQNPMLAELARRIIAQHGLSDMITVISKRSTDLVVGVDMAQRADLVVSEIVDCGLIGEGVLPTVAHAREHLLALHGTLLPEGAHLFGALLDSPAVAGLNRVRSAGGFDLDLLNSLSTPGHFPVRLPTWPHRLLSPTAALGSFDFRFGPTGDGSQETEVQVAESGTAHGLAVWFELVLGGGIVLRNSPENLASHWMQAFVSFAEPVELRAGDRFRVELSWQRGRLYARGINVMSLMEGPK